MDLAGQHHSGLFCTTNQPKFHCQQYQTSRQGRDRFLQRNGGIFQTKCHWTHRTSINLFIADDSYTPSSCRFSHAAGGDILSRWCSPRNSLKAATGCGWITKETAQWLGTPISSLVAWIEFLKLKISILPLSEIDRRIAWDDCPAFLEDRFRHDLRQADLREVVRRR